MDQTRALLDLYADRGPAWRAAILAGHDMALVEKAMRQSYEERLDTLESVVGELLALRESMRGASDTAA